MNNNQMKNLSNLDKRSELKSDLIKQLEIEGNENADEVAENIINTYVSIAENVSKALKNLARAINEIAKTIIPVINELVKTFKDNLPSIGNIYIINFEDEIKKHLSGKEYAIYRKTKKKRTKEKYFVRALKRMSEDDKH